MKRLFLFLLFCCAGLLGAREESVIRTLDNRDMKVSSIRALPDGSLEYTLAGGKVKTTMPRGKYMDSQTEGDFGGGYPSCRECPG